LLLNTGFFFIKVKYEQNKKRKRSQLGLRRKRFFLNCFSKYKHVIEDPKKDFSSNKKKHEAWSKIDFNLIHMAKSKR
jgi:hypothetical protein